MVDAPDTWPAWLEDADGRRTPVHGSCSLGRAESNDVTLADDTVSRRHAMIHAQGEREYWLVDFGSRNGSYVNGQRIAQPTRLHDGATVAIGRFQYVFRQLDSTALGPTTPLTSDETLINVRWAKCWLLVADIINSTRLVTELPTDTLPWVTGRWLAQCKEIIEMHGGRINQFLGDGFFAFWHDHEQRGSEICEAHKALRSLQAEGAPAFRFVTHLGPVMLGGVSVGEEERMSGPEVHFVFRMEKLAGALGQARLISEPARKRLPREMEVRDAGRHPLQGFEGHFQFYIA